MSKTKIKTTKSSGNVFKDLGLANPEKCLVKAELAYQINQLIEKADLTQKEAAKLLKIDQPKISALKSGRLAGFSVERLFKFLAIFNQDIEIIIRPHKETKRTAAGTASHIHVRYIGP